VTTVEHHAAHPEVSIEAHTRRRQRQLAASLPPRRIYLDTKFWLIARDVLRGERREPDDVRFVGQMERVVARGDAVCPISEAVFLELMKQEDRASRRATATLIDRWSLGASLIPAQMRMATELAHFFNAVQTPEGLYPLDELVWSKLSYIRGFVHPHATPFDPAVELAVQKAFLDHMWERPLVEMIDHLTGFGGDDFDVDRSQLAETLNVGVAEHAHTIADFPSAYCEEARGIADLLSGEALEILADMAAKQGVGPPAPSDRPEQQRRVRAVIAGLLGAPAAQLRLRTPHILTSFHAAVRANKGRKFKPNDLLDFDHAAAALGYCHAFFTDGPMRKLITLPPLALDKQFQCFVASESGVAADYLEAPPAMS
jgi:hypothetical protein